ncbi:bifunctional DNA primase/polymerase [Streptomyces sp. MS19]|uniref:bifunctional DNA primase/polymerase n=1 Tax=Streptomyces sp. MS19 TaxID=3385972 RepID=UPI00399F2929
MTPDPRPALLRVALNLAARGVPVLPLNADKRPVANCPSCERNRCGGRPNMKTAGPCQCAAPCHAWAAATTDPAALTSPAWARAWSHAGGVGYHPGGAGVTVVDLDSAAAVAWARETLPETRTVATTRGEHWIYRGAMTSHNAVRPGVDIKSSMAYARWRGPGDGAMALLPDAVRALPRKDGSPGGGAVVSRARWDRTPAAGCRHTVRFVTSGVERGLAKVRARTEQGAGSQAFGVARFLASRHAGCPGPCGLEAIGWEIVRAAVAVGVPEAYAVRAVERGFAEAGAELVS